MVRVSLPSGTQMLFRGIDKNHSPSSVSLDVTKSYVGKICFSSYLKSNNRAIRTLFQREIVTVPYILSHWASLLNGKLICWRKVWLLPQKYHLRNKVKEVSYKLIHRFYPASHYLQNF